MDFVIIQALETDAARAMLQALSGMPFADGKASAKGGARDVKNNLQAERGDDLAQLEQVVREALFRNPTFQAFAMPRRVRTPIFSRYEPGMCYGDHVDGSIMYDNGNPMRADLSMTLFLSDPGSYDGGELTLERPQGSEEIKLAQGEAIIYPTTAVHRVAPVTRGTRVAVVTWVESAVRDERFRSILYDVSQATRQVEQGEDPMLLLAKVYHNLARLTLEF